MKTLTGRKPTNAPDCLRDEGKLGRIGSTAKYTEGFFICKQHVNVYSGGLGVDYMSFAIFFSKLK